MGVQMVECGNILKGLGSGKVIAALYRLFFFVWCCVQIRLGDCGVSRPQCTLHTPVPARKVGNQRCHDLYKCTREQWKKTTAHQFQKAFFIHVIGR